MSAHPLDEVFPVGEVIESWDGEHYWRGPTGRNGCLHAFAAFRRDDFCDDVVPVWIVAVDRCPEYDRIATAPDGAWCCHGECEGRPCWQVVEERVPGARRAWRSA